MNAHCEDPYVMAAERYRPSKTFVLFVAEVPPSSVERYFYFEEVKRADWLWIALMKALYASEWGPTKTERLRKKHWLVRFQKSGFRLIDAAKQPVHGSFEERVALIKEAAPELISAIKKIAPKQIVLVKTTVHLALYKELSRAGLHVVNEKLLPFPAAGWKTVFHEQIRRLIIARKLRLPAGECADVRELDGARGARKTE